MSRVQMFVTNSVSNDARVLRESRALADAGHEVEVVGRLEPGASAEAAEGEVRIVYLDGAHPIERLARRALSRRPQGDGSEGAVVTPEMLSARGALGTAGIRIALGTHLTLTWLAFARRALTHARRNPADVLVAHDLDTLPIVVRAAKRSGARVLYDSHELYVEHESEPPRSRLTRRVQRLVESRLIHRADGVVTVNESIAAELADRYGISKPDVVMNVPAEPPSDPRPVDLKGMLGIPPSRPVAIYVGGLAAGRGLEQLATAAGHLPDTAVVFLGPGREHFRSRLRSIAAEAGASERVFLLDAVAADQVTRHAAGADVGIVPYRNTCLNNYLSLPNKLFEYLAAGLPVVVSDFPELRRVVAAAGIGATCDPDDPRDIARAISAVVAPPGGKAGLAEAVRQAGREYTWDRERRRLLRAVAQIEVAV